jgi:HlyD family secretion protein
MSRALAAVPLALALAALLAACGPRSDGGGATVSGHIEATEVRIAAKVGGRLELFALKEGDRVEKGQVVATIDATDTRLAIATAAADRDAARAELALRVAGARQEDIAEARAQVATIEADLAGAERELVRFEGLLASGSGTGKTRDDALTRRDALRARLAAAKQTVAKLERGSRSEEIDAARARVAAAEARIAQLEQQATDATITSPVAGFVTEKTAEQGELLAPGALLAVVTDLGSPWLTIYIGAPDLPRLRLGQSLEIATDAGDRRTGKITYVSPSAEFTPKNVQTRDERLKLVYRVKVGLENGDGLFKPGMPAEARLP